MIKISSIEDIEQTIQLFIQDLIDKIYISFDKTYLKIYFFKKLKVYKDIKIIRCDSSPIRLETDLDNVNNELLIFDEYKNSENNIKEKVDKYNGVFIC